MREYVKSEALVDIDGENNMLYELVKFQPVGERSFANHLVANLPSRDTPKNARQNAEAFFSEQFEEMPLLSIGVPVHLDEWDAKTFVPLVAVELSDYDDQVSQYVRAYDAAGELHLLTLEEAPDVPTVVIRMNERIESRGKIAGKLMYDASDFVPQTSEFSQAVRQFDNHILSRVSYGKVTNAISARICLPGQHPPGCEEPPPPRPPGGGTPPCNSRDCKSGQDKIYSLKFNTTTDFKQLELWTDRYLELYVHVFAQNIGFNPMKIKFGDSDGKLHYNYLQNCPNNCSAKVYVANKSLQFQWNPTTNGQIIGFRWMEEDPASSISVSFGYSPCPVCPSISVGYSRSKEDDELGDRLVNYNSGFSTQHQLDKMYFTLSRQVNQCIGAVKYCLRRLMYIT